MLQDLHLEAEVIHFPNPDAYTVPHYYKFIHSSISKHIFSTAISSYREVKLLHLMPFFVESSLKASHLKVVNACRWLRSHLAKQSHLHTALVWAALKQTHLFLSLNRCCIADIQGNKKGWGGDWNWKMTN